MQRNVGTLDRTVRVILGLGLLSLFAILAPPLHWLGLVGLVPLATAAMGNCPLYSIIGVSTCPTKS